MDKLDRIAAKGTQIEFLNDDDYASDRVTDLGVSALPKADGKEQAYCRQLHCVGKNEKDEEVSTIVYIVSTNKDVPINGNIPLRLNKKGNWVSFIA